MSDKKTPGPSGWGQISKGKLHYFPAEGGGSLCGRHDRAAVSRWAGGVSSDPCPRCDALLWRRSRKT